MVLHLLCECEVAQNVWKALERWLTRKLGDGIELDVMTIMLSNYEGSHRTLINTLTIIFKQHLYASKCLGNYPTFMTCLTTEVEYHQIEKVIAYRNKKMQKHYKIWSSFIDM